MRPESLARSGVVSLAGSGVAAVAALAVTVVVGNGLGAEGTGFVFQAIGVFTVLTQALKLGTNSTIVRSVAHQRAFHARGELWQTTIVAVVPVLLLSAIAALLVGRFAGGLADVLGGGSSDHLAGMLRVLAPFLVLAAVLGVLQTVTRMVNGVVAFTLLQSILLPVARVAAVLAAVWAGADALGTVSAWLVPIPVVLALTVALLLGPLVRDWRKRAAARRTMRAAAGDFWRFSSARAVGATLESLAEWADVLLVAALASPAAAGVYAVVTRTVRAGQIVDRAMRIAVSPRISEQLALDDRAAARDLHTAATRLMILATWPYYLLLITLGPAVLRVFGEEFGSGAGVLAVISAVVMVSAAAGMLQSVLLQGGRSSWQMANKAVAVAVLIGGDVVLLPVLGLPGAAIAFAAAAAVDVGLAAVQVHRGLGIHLQPRKLLLAAALPATVFGLGGLAARAAVGDRPLAALVSAALLAAPYALALLLLRRRLGLDRVLASLGRRRGSGADALGDQVVRRPDRPAQPLPGGE